MAIANGYATQAELSAWIASANDQPLISADNRNTEMDLAIEAASRDIDGHCHRRFYVDGSVTARVYRATKPTCLRTEDISTATGLIVKTDSTGDGTYDTTWASGTDYQLEPLNGVVDQESGWPYFDIVAVGSKVFPIDAQGRTRVEISADWGWAAVPTAIKTGCLIAAHRILKRPSSPQGVAGFGEFGVVRLTSIDRDVERLIGRYVDASKMVA